MGMRHRLVPWFVNQCEHRRLLDLRTGALRPVCLISRSLQVDHQGEVRFRRPIEACGASGAHVDARRGAVPIGKLRDVGFAGKSRGGTHGACAQGATVREARLFGRKASPSFSSNGACTSGVRCFPGNDGLMNHQAANTSSASPSAVLAPDPLVTVTARTASCGAWTMQGTSLEEG